MFFFTYYSWLGSFNAAKIFEEHCDFKWISSTCLIDNWNHETILLIYVNTLQQHFCGITTRKSNIFYEFFSTLVKTNAEVLKKKTQLCFSTSSKVHVITVWFSTETRWFQNFPIPWIEICNEHSVGRRYYVGIENSSETWVNKMRLHALLSS